MAFLRPATLGQRLVQKRPGVQTCNHRVAQGTSILCQNLQAEAMQEKLLTEANCLDSTSCLSTRPSLREVGAAGWTTSLEESGDLTSAAIGTFGDSGMSTLRVCYR